ncbi:MAG: hypothetical protein R3Y29_04125 [bacterium]
MNVDIAKSLIGASNSLQMTESSLSTASNASSPQATNLALKVADKSLEDVQATTGNGVILELSSDAPKLEALNNIDTLSISNEAYELYTQSLLS